MEGTELRFEAASFFFTARKRVFRSYPAFTIFRRRYFPHRSFSITIHANWMKKKKRFDARIPYCPRGNIFRPWNRIVIDHGCDSHAFRTRTRARDTRWIFSCSFELMKRADYQTLRHPYPRADTCANTPIVIMHPRISINDRIRPSSLLFLSSRQLLHPPRNNIPDEIFSLNLPR